MIEEWRDVVEFEGFYEVSNLGNLRKANGEMLSLTNSKGYRVVRLTKNKKRYIKSVHRLVGMAFIENNNSLPEINHINGIKSDNRSKNLEWCNRKQNVEHANKMGLCNYSKKLTKKDALKIRELIENGKTVTSVARLFNISVGTCSSIKNFKHWK